MPLPHPPEISLSLAQTWPLQTHQHLSAPPQPLLGFCLCSPLTAASELLPSLLLFYFMGEPFPTLDTSPWRNSPFLFPAPHLCFLKGRTCLPTTVLHRRPESWAQSLPSTCSHLPPRGVHPQQCLLALVLGRARTCTSPQWELIWVQSPCHSQEPGEWSPRQVQEGILLGELGILSAIWTRE